jgi:D-cysteine desulfhydrase
LLGSWPTPLEPAPRLAAAVGLAADALWMKRDDLSGLGGGGNKVRKLQYTCAQALAAGATTVITSGAPQSNQVTVAEAEHLRAEAQARLYSAEIPDQRSVSAARASTSCWPVSCLDPRHRAKSQK